MDQRLYEKLKQVPKKPGVYLLKDGQGHILYVGKAKQLADRLRSHFNPGRSEDPRHARMRSRVRDFEIILTDSEVEALILEANFVKEHRPRYNVNLKDDKSYPYIRVSAEPYPRVFVTRRIIRDGSRYFGPYTDVHTLRRLMAAIRRLFPIRTCRLAITEESIRQKKHRVCLMYHIGRCRGPCEGLVSEAEYGRLVGTVVSFIEGRNTELIQHLTEHMNRLAQKEAFEEAARVRDQIRFVEHFQRRQKVADMEEGDRDLLAVAMEGQDACGVVFHVRSGKIINRQHFHLDGVEGKMYAEVVQAFLEQYYVRAETIPPEIFLPVSLEDEPEITAWLARKRRGQVMLRVPKRGDKAGLMAMCQKNATLLLDEIRLQRMGGLRVSPMVEALQRDLRLPRPPLYIEAFDNSNIQGRDAVAALVVFQNGKPKKSEYRKYKIRTVAGIDDYASMAEVVERRITRLLQEKKRLPDLILVDGGQGQVSATLGVLQRHAVEGVPVVGLAKRLEEIYLPGIPEPQTLPKSSASLRLLQQVRDEAHRFAIRFHRSLRKKRTVASELDQIPGIGEKRRTALLKAFGSIEAIRVASLEALLAVEGMNRKAAEAIHHYFRQDD